MKEIPLTRGKVSLVDDADYDWLMQWKWHVSGHPYYACRSNSFVNGKQLTDIKMHRDIMNPPKGMVVDHINHDRLDNQRANLRVCTFAQNMQNSIRQRSNKSGYIGVSWHSRDKYWIAYVKVNSKLIHLGHFDDIIAAARARDTAAKLHHGEFACLNFPDTTRV